jgi:glycosyltransferase involved in cell wall biosynthesis
MKILHVISSLNIGGGELVAIRLAAAQRAAGHDASILAAAPGPLQSVCDDADVPVHSLASKGIALRVLLLRFFATHRFDIVNSHNSYAHRYAHWSHFVSPAPLLCTRHGQGLVEYGELYTAARVAAIVAVSAEVERSFLRDVPRYPPDRITVIGNGVDIASDAQPRRPETTRPWLQLFLAARLDPVKDIGTLLRAVAEVRRLHDVRLRIAGDGPEHAALRALAQELDLGAAVEFAGFQRDLAPLYRDADVYVMSSVTEGMPLSLLEAMASGLPAVATAVGGIPEVITAGESGLLVPPRDVPALATAITALATDPAGRCRMGAAALARVRADFSLARTASRYLTLYEMVRQRH